MNKDVASDVPTASDVVNIERLLGKAWLGNYGFLEQD